MANYHQTGFHTLQELAKEKQAEQALTELDKFQEAKREEMKRRLEAFSDCD